jgi:hypothetical protein
VDQTAFCDTPGDAAPFDNIRNVRIVTLPDGRKRMGVRPPIIKTFSTQLGSGNPLSLLATVGRATSATLEIGSSVTLVGGDSTDPSPGTTVPPTITGCFFALNATGTIVKGWEDASYTSASAVCCDIDATGAVFCTYVTKAYGGGVGNKNISRVHYIERDVDWSLKTAIEWTAEVEDIDPAGTVGAGAVALFAARVRLHGSYVFVAAFKYVYVFNRTTGAYLKRYDLDGWAWEVQDIVRYYRAAYTPTVDFTNLEVTWAVDATNSLDLILVSYRGDNAVSGDVSSATNVAGSYARAAVRAYKVTTDTADPLEHVSNPWLGRELSTSQTEESGDLRTARLIETERGRIPFALLTVERDDAIVETENKFTAYNYLRAAYGAQLIYTRPAVGLVMATTNDGFKGDATGPSGAGGYFNLWRLDEDGSIKLAEFRDDDTQVADEQMWRVDTDSLRRSHLATYFNDVPYNATGAINPTTSGVGIEASAQALAYSTTGGYIFAAGQVSNGFNVHCHRFTTGERVWRATVGGNVAKNAAALLVSLGNPGGTLVVGGQRNSSWTGSGGANASLWLIRPTTGDIIKGVDFGTNLDCYGVAAAAHTTGAFPYIVAATEHT